MSTDTPLRIPARLHALAAMAGLLERLERQPRGASATQYRGVIQQLQLLLSQAEPGAEFDGLLRLAPATAEVYENMCYDQAGLCRSPLEPALDAELAAGQAIALAARGAAH
jgi:hypothetical protein